MKTYALKQKEIRKEWHLIDAENLILGRVASQIAILLRGKHRPYYTPHLDCGDNVVVINAAKIKLKGNNKLSDKKFYWHTGYPGGIKEISAEDTLNGKFPERLLMRAVKRMLPKNVLGRQQFSQLKVYPDANHKHQAQEPVKLDIAGKNRKNTISSKID